MGDLGEMTITLECTVDDTPKPIGDGEAGKRDDEVNGNLGDTILNSL